MSWCMLILVRKLCGQSSGRREQQSREMVRIRLRSIWHPRNARIDVLNSADSSSSDHSEPRHRERRSYHLRFSTPNYWSYASTPNGGWCLIGRSNYYTSSLTKAYSALLVWQYTSSSK